MKILIIQGNLKRYPKNNPQAVSSFYKKLITALNNHFPDAEISIIPSTLHSSKIAQMVDSDTIIIAHSRGCFYAKALKAYNVKPKLFIGIGCLKEFDKYLDCIVRHPKDECSEDPNCKDPIHHWTLTDDMLNKIINCIKGVQHA